MGRTGQRHWWAIGRLMVLSAVLAGVFGMHALTAHDAGAAHGALPMVVATAHGAGAGHETSMGTDGSADGSAAASPDGADGSALPPDAAAAVGAAGGGPGGEHPAVAACILFLAIGGAALLSALLRRRGPLPVAGSGRLAVATVTDVRRRGPPPGWPRVSLNVIRV